MSERRAFDDQVFSKSARGLSFSAIRRMSALAERPGVISFAPGHPSPDTFPTGELREIVDEIAGRESAGAFQYIPTRGLQSLVTAVAEYAAAKGIRAEPDEVLLTEGSQQGLDLMARALVDPGDVVLVELPSYIGATSAFRAAQARLVGVRLTERGLDLADLRRRHQEVTASGAAVKLLYVVPNFQNPSGVCHTLEQRRGLLEAARELELLILEDDPYGDLYFEAPPPPTLMSMDEDGRVVYLSSFSKILAPGLRTAFLVGPAELLAKLEVAKQSANLCGSGLDQRVILACLRRGVIERQKGRVRPYYREKRDTMMAALTEEMPREATWAMAGGGLFLWPSLPEGMDAEALLDEAVAAGVAYVAGRPFFVDASGSRTLRLTFAREDGPAIREGVRRLARVVNARLSALRSA